MSKRRLKKLRDPTRDELHNGPGKEQLPEQVRAMGRKETVCSFCGVSYLVFSEIKELEKVLATTKRELIAAKGASKKVDALKGRVSELEEDLQKQSEALIASRLAREAAEMDAEVQLGQVQARLDEAMRKLTDEQSRSSAELDAMKASRDDLEARLANQENASRRLEEALRKELSALEADRAQEASKYQDAASRMSRMEAEHKAAAAQVQDDIAKMKRDHQGALDAAESALSTMRASRDDLDAKKSRLEEEAEASMQREGSLCEKIAALEASCAQEASKAAEAASKVSKMEAEREAEAAAMRQKMAIMRRDSASCDSLAAELATMRVARGDLETQRARMAQEIATSKRREADLVKRLADVEALRAQEARKAREAESAISQMRADGEADTKAAIDREMNMKEEHRKALEMAACALKDTQKARDELDGEIARLVELAEAAKRREELLQKKLDEMSADREREASKARDAAARISSLQSNRTADATATREKISKLSAARDSLSAELASTARQLKMWKRRAEAAENDTSKADALRSEVASITIAKDEAIADAANLRAQLREDSTAFEEGLEGLERHLISMSEVIRKKEVEIKLLKATVAKECAERTVLLEELEELRG